MLGSRLKTWFLLLLPSHSLKFVCLLIYIILGQRISLIFIISLEARLAQQLYIWENANLGKDRGKPWNFTSLLIHVVPAWADNEPPHTILYAHKYKMKTYWPGDLHFQHFRWGNNNGEDHLYFHFFVTWSLRNSFSTFSFLFLFME